MSINQCANVITGSTAMNDAINKAMDALSTLPTTSDWIITLTDGEDNSSSLKHNALVEKLKKSHVNLIMIGVGRDVLTNELQQLAACTKKGLYIGASGDAKGINEAFTKAVAVIQG